MQDRGLFSESFIQQPSIFQRLAAEGGEAWRELRQDPARYVVSAIKGDGIGGRRRQERLMYGMAIALVIIGAGLVFILWQDNRAKAQTAEEEEKWEVIARLDDLTPQEVDAPKADKKAGGGGGGGTKTPTPPSKGQPPKYSLEQQVAPPTPTPPVLNPPLPRPPETIQVDPRLEPKRDPLALTGLKTGVEGPPSAGPGEGGGMGTGRGTGLGSGDGTGLGPGRGYNTGGGDPSIGGGDRNVPQRDVDSRPILLSRIRPNYTEEARKNKIQGSVRVRITIGPDGGVKSVKVISGLPDGLTEEAIRAAYQLRFKAAIKNGQPVAYVLPVDIEFNLR